MLVVDDDASIRESVKKILQAEGYEVLLAADGQEAVARYDPGRINLLLLDIELPNCSGWDTFENFTTKNPWLAVIVITGHAEQYRVAAAAGVSAFMEKPIDAAELLRTIQDLLAEPKEARIRRLIGRGSRPRYVPPDAHRVFHDLHARYSTPFRWELPASAFPATSALRHRENKHKIER
ncbi:MAG: response regulator [Verrucomicrobia bacterium]|nr:response regulator [Verrucomicrobiota bacterium]